MWSVRTIANLIHSYTSFICIVIFSESGHKAGFFLGLELTQKDSTIYTQVSLKLREQGEYTQNNFRLLIFNTEAEGQLLEGH